MLNLILSALSLEFPFHVTAIGFLKAGTSLELPTALDKMRGKIESET